VKIGIVTQSYYPRYGGVTEHVHHTAVELRRRGHQVTIVTSRFRKGEMNHSDHVERIGYNVLVPFNRSFVDFTMGLRLRQELRRILREHDFDVVHTHCPAAPTLPIMAIQAATCAQVGTFHSTHPRGLLQDLFKNYLTETVVSKLDERIAVSKTAEASAQLYYPGHYHLIPNGVDTDRFHPSIAPFEEWRDPDRVNLLFVGRLDPRKGVQFLLGAMPEILERTRGRARLLVIGDSYLRTRLEAMVPGAARDHVQFMGHVPSQDLPRWYATGDIFISPALSHESFGIVLLEALATGRPVVASDIPGYRSVLDPDEHALLFPPGDVPALAKAVSSLVLDETRRRDLANRGRARALEFAWPKVTERIEAVYALALGKRGAPAIALSAAS
jgi:phosphatidyl-myo-inositol alpha-mannosyltransferase